jgi:hypothetical protein
MDKTSMMVEAARLVEFLTTNQLVQSKGITDKLTQDVLVTVRNEVGGDPAKMESNQLWPLYILLIRIKNSIMAGDRQCAAALAKSVLLEVKK